MTLKTISEFAVTEQMIEQFYREGYFYAPGFITPEAVEELNGEYARYAGENAGPRWKASVFTHLAEHASGLPVTASLLTATGIVKSFERVLGDKVKLWLGMYAVVPPRGNGLEWHQDNMYTHILGHMLNGFIALDSIDEHNACLWIAPGSHLLGRQLNLNEDENDHRRAATPANGEPCRPMKPGDAVIFHRETLHSSGMNNTDLPRRAFAFQVASTACRFAETGKLLEDRDMLSDMLS